MRYKGVAFIDSVLRSVQFFWRVANLDFVRSIPLLPS